MRKLIALIVSAIKGSEEVQQPELLPAEDTDNTPGLGDQGVDDVDATGSSETGLDETEPKPVDDPVRSPLPVNPVPVNPGLQEKGADLRQPRGNWVPGSVDAGSVETSFAERFGLASVVSHGGLVLTAAALGHTAGQSRRGKHRENQSREKSVDRIIRRYGTRRPMAARKIH